MIGTAMGILGIPGKVTCEFLRIPRVEFVESEYRDQSGEMNALPEPGDQSGETDVLTEQSGRLAEVSSA